MVAENPSYRRCYAIIISNWINVYNLFTKLSTYKHLEYI